MEPDQVREKSIGVESILRFHRCDTAAHVQPLRENRTMNNSYYNEKQVSQGGGATLFNPLSYEMGI